ncbi:MAG TPA: hypothetical protein VMY39_06870, partial [Planctomycetota bacterium]|nr:hypothetical protein [Planctomycetota bacterium]
VWLHYGGEPVLRPNVARDVGVTVDGAPPANVALSVPDGWTATSLGDGRFRVFSARPVADRNTLVVKVDGGEVAFTMLGPGEAKGFAAGDNVAMCLKCRARVEACICKK